MDKASQGLQDHLGQMATQVSLAHLASQDHLDFLVSKALPVLRALQDCQDQLD